MRSLALAALCVTGAAATASAGTIDWSKRASLPCYARLEARLLTSGDQEAATAEIKGWMEERKGEITYGPNGPRWIIPIGDMRDLDKLLGEQGKVRRLPVSSSLDKDDAAIAAAAARGEKTVILLPMIDAKDAAAKRDALRRDLDAIEGRAPAIPGIVGLAEAYAASLDEIVAARERYDKLLSVMIKFNDDLSVVAQGPARDHDAGLLGAALLPDVCGRSHWGRVRVPNWNDPVVDYFDWNELTPPSIEDVETLKVTIIEDDPAAGLAKIDKPLRALGGVPVPLPPQYRDVWTSNTRAFRVGAVAPYWVPREKLDGLKDLAQSQGEMLEWEWPSHPRGQRSFEAARWIASLGEELRGQEDRLSSFPAIQSLVTFHLRALSLYIDLIARSDSDELVAVQVVKKFDTRDYTDHLESGRTVFTPPASLSAHPAFPPTPATPPFVKMPHALSTMPLPPPSPDPGGAAAAAAAAPAAH